MKVNEQANAIGDDLNCLWCDIQTRTNNYCTVNCLPEITLMQPIPSYCGVDFMFAFLLSLKNLRVKAFHWMLYAVCILFMPLIKLETSTLLPSTRKSHLTRMQGFSTYLVVTHSSAWQHFRGKNKEGLPTTLHTHTLKSKCQSRYSVSRAKHIIDWSV